MLSGADRRFSFAPSLKSSTPRAVDPPVTVRRPYEFPNMRASVRAPRPRRNSVSPAATYSVRESDGPTRSSVAPASSCTAPAGSATGVSVYPGRSATTGPGAPRWAHAPSTVIIAKRIAPRPRLVGLQVRMLAMQRLVEPDLVVGRADLDGGDAVNHRQHPVREDERVRGRRDDGQRLFDEERRVAVHQPVRSGRVHGLVAEDRQSEDPDHSPDAVNAPHVERVVPLQLVLERDRVVAHDARDDAA